MNEVKNVGIKVSGDLLHREWFYDFVRKKASKYYTVVIVGGGTDINEALLKAGYTPDFDKNGRRITKTEEERAIMRTVLEKNTTIIQNKFIGTGVIVKPSFLNYAEVLCPINGDDFLTTIMYIGYDELYVLTEPSRFDNKLKKFKNYPKIEVISIPETAQDFAQKKNCAVWKLVFDDNTTELIAVASCIDLLSETAGWLIKHNIVTNIYLDLDAPDFSYESYFEKKVVETTQLFI